MVAFIIASQSDVAPMFVSVGFLIGLGSLACFCPELVSIWNYVTDEIEVCVETV